MRIGSQTTNHRTPIRANDGCQLPRLRLCTNDRRRQRQNTQLKKENFRASRIRIEGVFTSSTKNVNLLQRVLSNKPCIRRIQPYFVGNNLIDTRNDRQQVGNKVLPNKNCSTHNMERMRLCTTIQIPHHARSRDAKHGCRFLISRLDLNPKERVELKIRNDITIRPIQVNIQSTDVADEEQLFSFQKKLSKLKKKSYCRKNKQDRMHAQSQ